MATDSGAQTPVLKPPLAMLAELTHRCPLQCPYCSNPLELARRSDELTTAEWVDVFEQAAALGVLQVHLSGGEPTARSDLQEIVAAARAAGLYSNLITAGVLLTRPRLEELVEVGLDHVQLSIQDSDPANAERIGNYAGGFERKMAVAGWVRELELPLTVNAVVHRQNLDHLEGIIALARRLGAHRLPGAFAAAQSPAPDQYQVPGLGGRVVQRVGRPATRATPASCLRSVARARSRHRPPRSSGMATAHPRTARTDASS